MNKNITLSALAVLCLATLAKPSTAGADLSINSPRTGEFTICHHNDPVGNLLWKPDTHNPEIAKINILYVMPHYRSCGYASALLQYALAYLRTQGFCYIRLHYASFFVKE
jgi:GNAT superfamily N-acetyltransferase